MTNRKNLFSRHAYTLFDLLGDYGGFNEAFFTLIGAFISTYSAKMYQNSISQELKVQHHVVRPQLQEQVSHLQRKFGLHNDREPEEVTPADIQSLSLIFKKTLYRL